MKNEQKSSIHFRFSFIFIYYTISIFLSDVSNESEVCCSGIRRHFEKCS